MNIIAENRRSGFALGERDGIDAVSIMDAGREPDIEKYFGAIDRAADDLVKQGKDGRLITIWKEGFSSGFAKHIDPRLEAAKVMTRAERRAADHAKRRAVRVRVIEVPLIPVAPVGIDSFRALAFGHALQHADAFIAAGPNRGPHRKYIDAMYEFVDAVAERLQELGANNEALMTYAAAFTEGYGSRLTAAAAALPFARRQ